MGHYLACLGHIVWVATWPQPKPEDKGPWDNRRLWFRNALKEPECVDWWEYVLRGEWMPNGDFLVRFGTKRSG